MQKQDACGVGARLGALVGAVVGAPVGCGVVGLVAAHPTSLAQLASHALSYVLLEEHVTGL